MNLKGGTELELEDEETDEEELQEGGEMEDEDDWGGKEFVSDLSEEDDGLSDLEDAVVRTLALAINSHTTVFDIAVIGFWGGLVGQ